MGVYAKRAVTCCFTGHRAAKLPWGYNESDGRCVDFKRRLRDAVEAVYRSGVRHYICGMANGCDMYFAETVIGLRDAEPGVTLEVAVPHPGQADGWGRELRARYDSLLDRADLGTLISLRYTHDCMQRRNEYMVDRSGVLIAAYDGLGGGTLNTLRYALRSGIEIIQLPL